MKLSPWPEDDLRSAFLAGAKWWEFTKLAEQCGSQIRMKSAKKPRNGILSENLGFYHQPPSAHLRQKLTQKPKKENDRDQKYLL